ncbi:MAG: hypothetical protein ACRD29_19130 [Acidimicrobiales bacterium]
MTCTPQPHPYIEESTRRSSAGTGRLPSCGVPSTPWWPAWAGRRHREAGIGKTRLLEEAADLPTAAGASAVGELLGRGGAPAYWPRAQIVRQLFGDDRDAELLAAAPMPRPAARLCVSVGTRRHLYR